MSSSTQDEPSSSPTHPAPSISPPSGHSELTFDDAFSISVPEHAFTHGPTAESDNTPNTGQISTVMQLDPANMLKPLGHHVVNHSTSENVVASVSSDKSSRIGFRKRVSAFFKGDRKAKDATSAEDEVTDFQDSPAREPSRSINYSHTSTPDVKVVAVSSALSMQAADAVVSKVAVPIIQVQANQTFPTSDIQDIFPKNVGPATLTTPLPKPYARIEQTTQLVYCNSLLAMTQQSSLASDADEPQAIQFDGSRQQWLHLIEPVEQDHLRWLVEKLVRAFIEDEFKASASIAEVVILGPILDREKYRALLSCFISQFEETKLLDVGLLQGLVQLTECALEGYLVDDDLVRIATVLFRELSVTHNGNNDHVLLLTLALCRVLDVMVAGKVKDLSRDRDHQPMLQLLDGLKSGDNAYIKYQAAYAYQALQYAPDDETPLQVVWRYSKMAAASASIVSSVFRLDPAGLLQGIESIQEIGMSVVEAVKAGIDAYPTLIEGVGTAVRTSEKNFDYMKKRSWYLALQGTALFIRQGRLSDFKQVIFQAPCSHDVNFQWGICRQLGEIAVDPLWDEEIRQQAIDLLGKLFRENADWRPHEDVKRCILTILCQISSQSDLPYQDHALTLLNELKANGDSEFPHTFPLRARLPLPASFPLLVQAQGIPKVGYDLHKLRMQRIAEYKQAVYIAPFAKPSLQATDDSLFPLMDKVEEFLAGEGQVMLILGDSGAGKSTFNRYLEYFLWQRYSPGVSIPLFINLPAVEQPEKELVAEQLRSYDFLEEHIRELKQHYRFVLICDGYDESQLLTNLHTTNNFNRSGHWDVKLLITCRTQYLGPDYRDRFVPKAHGEYHGTSNDLILEAVIAPFSSDQIELYVEMYVPLEPRTWVKADYMDKLMSIPNLMDLVKNPFLLTLALEALPDVVEGKSDLAKLRLTRVQLYDTFCNHWLCVNKRRLLEQKLKDEKLRALEDLLTDGFEQDGIDFQKKLAAAIFQKQEGRPVVEYSQRRDKSTWKHEFFGTEADVTLLREASLLSRVGNHYRFIHRSILEYFFSCAVWDVTRNNEQISPEVYLATTGNNFTIINHPLSMKNLVSEPSIIEFLVERVQGQPSFKRHLLTLIELSKSDSQASQAASNAITILTRASMRFNGMDLRGIRIPGADLTAAQFDSAQLQDSNLTAVNFTKAWIRLADFSRAQMEGVRFGELPFLEEDRSIWSCALSMDGKTFAAGTSGGSISIYDTITWSKTRSFHGHKDTVNGLCFSPSGDRLVSGSDDKSARLWNCKTGSIVFVLEGHTTRVRAVAFSPSGEQVASASAGGTVKSWDVRTGAELFALEGHMDEVSDIMYSPDGDSIYSCSMDGIVRSFDTLNGQLLLSSKKNVAGYRCIAYSSDGKRIVVGDDDGHLQLRRVVAMELELEWVAHLSYVSTVQFSPNGQLILSSSYDNTLKVWDVHTCTLVSTFAGHSSNITGAVFLPSTLQVVSTSKDESVRLWEINFTGTGADQDDTIKSRTIAAYSPDGRFVVSQGHMGTLQRYNADDGVSDLALRLQGSHFLCAAYSPTGLQIGTGDWKGGVTLWNAQYGYTERTLSGHSDLVSVVAYSPCGQWIGSGSNDGTVKVWDAFSGHSTLVFSHAASVESIAFSPDGLDIAVGCDYRNIQIWELSTGNTKTIIESGAWSAYVVYPPGRSQIACCHTAGGGGIRLFDDEAKTSRTILEYIHFRVDHFAFSSCGQWIATAQGRMVHLWTRISNELDQDWTHATTVEGFFADVSRISWRPNATEFATASEDGSIRAWKVVVEESSNAAVQLIWGHGGTGLAAPGAVLYGVIGLGAIDQKLLEQRGAVFESSKAN
ncbi:hypothetical protein BGZ95_002326, partial [Linnemannia exigua]